MQFHCIQKIKWGLVTASLLTTFTIESAGADTELPILMYHNLTTDPSQVTTMTMTAEQFRLDMEYLTAFGYTALLPEDLVKISAGEEEMPTHPVMVTFDDGYESNYTLAFPVLEETGNKATIAVIASHIRGGQDPGNESSMTWSQAKEMYESGLVDIGTHTYRLHNDDNKGMPYYEAGAINGIARKTGESFYSYQKRVGMDLLHSIYLIEQNVGNDVIYAAYPFGTYDKWYLPLMESMGIMVSASTIPKMANIENSLHQLNRFEITMEQTAFDWLSHTAQATPSTAVYNGKTLPVYQIEGEDYLRIRDLAYVYKNTRKCFQYSWNSEESCMELKIYQVYRTQGDECKPLDEGTKEGTSIKKPLLVEGQYVTVAGYQIGDETFYQAKKLLEILGLEE
jgi:peptidoglycan/xylan/chitin deacetylase (PgdA/CDA1 family)